MPPTYPPYNVPGSAPCDRRFLCGRSTNLSIPSPASEWHGQYQDYTQGYGGACEVYDPPRSPWCSDQFYLSRQFPESWGVWRQTADAQPPALVAESPTPMRAQDAEAAVRR